LVKLKHINNDVVINEIEMHEGTFTIGRNSSNDLQLNDAVVSGQHAVLMFKPNDYLPEMFDMTIRDLDSTNGTYVNNAMIKEQKIKHDDSIRIGNHEFKIFDDQADIGAQTEFYVPED